MLQARQQNTQYPLYLDKEQILSMFSTMNENDRLEIYNFLKKSLFLSRFDNLLNSLQTDELSLEDITKEVEAVRQER